MYRLKDGNNGLFFSKITNSSCDAKYNLRQSCHCIKMFQPVSTFYAGILNGIAGMNHHSVADINTDMGNGAGRVVRAGKEN